MTPSLNKLRWNFTTFQKLSRAHVDEVCVSPETLNDLTLDMLRMGYAVNPLTIFSLKVTRCNDIEAGQYIWKYRGEMVGSS